MAGSPMTATLDIFKPRQWRHDVAPGVRPGAWLKSSIKPREGSRDSPRLLSNMRNTCRPFGGGGIQLAFTHGLQPVTSFGVN